MLAVIAAICFLADLIHVPSGGVDLVALGLIFVALHLAFGGYVAERVPWRRRP